MDPIFGIYDGEPKADREQNIEIKAPDAEQEIQGESSCEHIEEVNDFEQNASANSDEEVPMEFIRPKAVRINFFSKYNAEDVNFKVAVSRFAQVRQQLEYYQLTSINVR